MSISRRTFLKLLSSIPAVASIPATAQLLATLPPVDPPAAGPAPAARALWLRINGVPINCVSMAINARRPEFVDATIIGSVAPTYRLTSVRDYALDAEFILDGGPAYTVCRDALWNDDDAIIEASLGGVTLKATGRFVRVDMNDTATGILTSGVEIFLRDVAYA